MKLEEKIEFIANHYGYDAQSRQCIEEMAELTQAINKFWRNQLDCRIYIGQFCRCLFYDIY